MSTQRKQLLAGFLLVCLSLTALTVAKGCKKKSEPALPAETKEIVSQAIEQKTCPVMEAPINRAPLNKELYTEYKGKKVYFCCPSCKERFEQAPEQYLSKLPQFNK